MKFTSLQENIASALQLITKIASTKTQLPVTTNVLLKAKETSIEFVGTDLENTIYVTVAGKIDEEGTVLVPTKTLNELIGSLPKEQLQVTSKDTRLHIKTSHDEVTINGINPEEFPTLPPLERKEVIPLVSLLEHIKLISLSASIDEGRVELTGIMLTVKEKNAILVATDGYRLSLKKIDLHEVLAEDLSVIIPAKLLNEVSRITHDTKDQKVELVLGSVKNQAMFLLENMTIFTRFIDGEFPKYERIIPTSQITRVTFDREELLKAVKISAIFAREGANIIRIRITKQNTIVSANTSQVGENICIVEGRLDGEENEIAFNSRFLLEFLHAIPGKEIVFEMTGPLNPGVFKIPGDDSYLHIIMPVRVQT